jgi:hypothetical protein
MRVEDAVRSLFPRGYTTYAMYREGIEASRRGEELPQRAAPNYRAPPSLATDLFAIAATLLLRSGAYHHVAPHMLGDHAARTISFTREEQKKLVAAGKKWRGAGQSELPGPPPLLRSHWAKLWSSRRESVFHILAPAAPVPDWWYSALALLIIADEAAEDVGFRSGAPSSAQAATIEALVRAKQGRREQVHTFSIADSDLASVLPKSRTPSVGCTLRSLSHHLALLPPRGVARAYWLLPLGAEEAEAERRAQGNPFNILLVPMPYKVRAGSFKGRQGGEDTNWGWFHVDAEWAPRTDFERSLQDDPGFDKFWQFLLAMIRDAERDVGHVHAVVFPETAMSWQIYEGLVKHLRDHTSIELFVSGLFDLVTKEPDGDRRLRRGNFAATTQFSRGDIRHVRHLVSVREKHHRWKLDRAQIQDYALGSALDPRLRWWEEITIESRSIDIFTLRGSATLTTLICEDLARHDPCQELIRGIGPNLVFALLMDGAQLPGRWSGRYATVLADDPGSSVLTFTSLGLIERTNDAGILPKSRQVGLWRDDRGHVIELSVPADSHGLCITLQPTPFVEYTLDGRGDDGGTQSWRLAAIRPVKGSGTGAVEVLDGRWPA